MSPKNAKLEAATSKTSTAAPPPPTSVGANVLGYEKPGNSTQKLPG
jgi:hypothetical protein